MEAARKRHDVKVSVMLSQDLVAQLEEYGKRMPRPMRTGPHSFQSDAMRDILQTCLHDEAALTKMPLTTAEELLVFALRKLSEKDEPTVRSILTLAARAAEDPGTAALVRSAAQVSSATPAIASKAATRGKRPRRRAAR